MTLIFSMCVITDAPFSWLEMDSAILVRTLIEAVCVLLHINAL